MWYGAKLTFHGKIAELSDEAMIVESYRLIDATSNSEAIPKANALGETLPSCFPGTVKWRFPGVTDVQNLFDFVDLDGMEVFSSADWLDRRVEMPNP